MLFARIFENRVMSLKQIGTELIPQIARQTISRRLVKLAEHSFLERRLVDNRRGKGESVYLNMPRALKEIQDCYLHQVSKPLCKSDSVEHDLQLVDLRRRIQSFRCVKSYLTENMLQACEKFTEIESIEPFVRNNTDGVLEILKNDRKIIIGLEFERSEKAFERYTRKLTSYHSDIRTSIIFYICTTTRIRETIAQAESGIVGKNPPRCLFALAEDVLRQDQKCTFTNIKGDTITLQ